MIYRHPLFLRSMAIKTQEIAFLGEELHVLRGMSRVAGYTVSFLEGTVLNRSARLQRRDIMAVRTELVPAFGGFERFI